MQKSKTNPLYITRFIAAYMVLVYHYIPGFFRSQFPAISKFDEPVNYFFFISGFVMIVSSKSCINLAMHQVSINKMDFWVKRFARIYPLYFVALLLFVLFNYIVSPVDSSIPKRLLPELLGIQRWLYKGSINYPAWTVSCEFFFYLVFPFALSWLIKTPLRKITTILATLFFVNLIISFLLNKHIVSLENNHDTKRFYYFFLQSLYNHPIFKLIVFLCGCLCGRYYIEFAFILNKYSKYSIYIVSICLIFIVIGYLKIPPRDPFLFAGVFCIVYFPFVLFLSNLNGLMLNLFSLQPLIFLGEISYGMYILQAPIEHYFEAFVIRGRIETGFQFFFYTLVLIAVSSLFFYLFETPVKNWIIQLFHKQVIRKSL